MYTKSVIFRARTGSLVGAIIGVSLGGLAAGWPLAYVGLISGSLLGCIGGVLSAMENGWQPRTIVTVFGGALTGLLIGPLLVLPMVPLLGPEILLLLVVAAAGGLLMGAFLGVLVSVRLVRAPVTA